MTGGSGMARHVGRKLLLSRGAVTAAAPRRCLRACIGRVARRRRGRRGRGGGGTVGRGLEGCTRAATAYTARATGFAYATGTIVGVYHGLHYATSCVYEPD